LPENFSSLSKSEPSNNPCGGKQFFKKKGKQKKFQGGSNHAGEFFKGVGFWTGKEGPKLYVKTIACLGLYICTQFKNNTTHGKVLEYLGITLDYMTKGKVKISMQEYVDRMLAGLPSDMNGVCNTPMTLHLFNFAEGAKKLPEAKLLYLCQRTWQDIQTAVAFLCT